MREIWPRDVYGVVWRKNRAIYKLFFTQREADEERSNLNAVVAYQAFVVPMIVRPARRAKGKR